MIALPPVAPVTGWRRSAWLPRDHYVRLDSSDYSVYPAAIGRRIEITADLDRVRCPATGTWPRTMTESGPDTRPSLTRRTWPRPALRQDRLEVIRPAAGSAVEIRRLADYDAALGTGGGAA